MSGWISFFQTSNVVLLDLYGKSCLFWFIIRVLKAGSTKRVKISLLWKSMKRKGRRRRRKTNCEDPPSALIWTLESHQCWTPASPPPLRDQRRGDREPVQAARRHCSQERLQERGRENRRDRTSQEIEPARCQSLFLSLQFHNLIIRNSGSSSARKVVGGATVTGDNRERPA